MGENVTTGSKTELLARIQRFTDQMLNGLDKASQAKDADEKEVRILQQGIQKSLKIWYKTLREAHHDPQQDEKLRQAEKQASQPKSAEA
jgi:hypothetical protein